MEIAHRWIDRNLTRLELVVSGLILFLFIGYFSHYMLAVFGKVEKSMVDRTLININSALNYEAAFAVMRRDTELIKKLMEMNPMELMKSQLTLEDIDLLDSLSLDLSNARFIASTPANYAGSIIDDDDPTLESGKWYFDKDDKFLFYKLNNSEFFSSDINGPARIRFKINLEYNDIDKDNSFNLLIDEFESIELKSIDHYEWSF